jgi:hypothetical protein
MLTLPALAMEPAPDTNVTNKTLDGPAKTDAAKAALPAVDVDTVNALKDAVIEGQSLQLQAAQLEKAYADTYSKLNANMSLQQSIMTEGCKKAGLDVKRCSIDVTVKGVTTFKLADEKK